MLSEWKSNSIFLSVFLFFIFLYFFRDLMSWDPLLCVFISFSDSFQFGATFTYSPRRLPANESRGKPGRRSIKTRVGKAEPKTYRRWRSAPSVPQTLHWILGHRTNIPRKRQAFAASTRPCAFPSLSVAATTSAESTLLSVLTHDTKKQTYFHWISALRPAQIKVKTWPEIERWFLKSSEVSRESWPRRN